jgi:hypothetical protein
MQKQLLLNLPDIDTLRRLSQSLAMLDALMSPDWEYKYYSFNSKWNEGEEMASMRNGSGDDYFILFNSHGAIIKGFAHESAMTPFTNQPSEVWRGVLDSVPDEFQDFLSEPAFSMEATTFCTWRRYSDSSWQVGDITYPNDENDPDGSEYLLQILFGDPSIYQKFAAEYYEKEIPLSAIQHIYEHRFLTDDIISDLNSEVSKLDLQNEIEEIGIAQNLLE